MCEGEREHPSPVVYNTSLLILFFGYPPTALKSCPLFLLTIRFQSPCDRLSLPCTCPCCFTWMTLASSKSKTPILLPYLSLKEAISSTKSLFIIAAGTWWYALFCPFRGGGMRGAGQKNWDTIAFACFSDTHSAFS